MADSQRIPTDGGPSLTQTAFAELSSEGLPAAPATGAPRAGGYFAGESRARRQYGADGEKL